MSLTAEQIEKSREEFEDRFSYAGSTTKFDRNGSGFYIQFDALCMWNAWLARQETLCEQKPNMTKMKAVMVSIV